MTGCKLLRAMPTALSLVLVAGGAPALAQSADTVSRAVVQPLPPAASDDLNAALLRLAADRRDVDALVSAGLASLSLDDIDAAIGFFGRAKELSPDNPRIAEGMGAAYVRSGRPVEALSLFEQADRAGIGTGALWADRGLAYDLVGQNDAAQTAYRRALQGKNDPAVRQRLALSYAIAGNRDAFEDELRPLLEERDYNAYRTRAFGLAVLGQADEALEIARAVMPRDLAGRMEPYLRFMPRLTKSQQAAAANLGLYPSATRIGRDDPRIASAAGAASAATPDAAAPTPISAGQGASVASSTPTVRDLRDPLSRTFMRPSRTRVAIQLPPPPVRQPEPEAQPTPEPQVAAQQAGELAPAVQQQAPGAAVRVAETATASAQAAPGLIRPEMGQPESRQAAPVFAAAQSRPPASPPVTGPVDLADAFAEFAEPTNVDVVGGDVVDISAITPKREKKEPPPPPPAPRRIWLQLGIGQDLALLRNDWRLKYRKIDALKGAAPFTTPWGQTNRLLAGPFESQADARKALNALSADDIDSFIWTSPEGAAVEPLG
ncbi:SPOR domain-containing protein [Alteriqipengyuania sp. NZ-12B]|uniref:SPOR domain-containing protein n=2 Tax=Alteriqipengyuania abyssalis TaxID=2860200 RepID=A0ABS7PFW3_9SPHN|nr:SPOR domain-containing protein [Alteriqipengyuania abyssalis]